MTPTEKRHLALSSRPLRRLAIVLLACCPLTAGGTAARHRMIAARPRIVAKSLPPTAALIERARYDAKRGVYLSPLPDGEQAELTLDHGLQIQFERILHDARLEAGAIVAMDPRTGRVLGMAETSRLPDAKGVAVEADFPAASVFKIVTAAALLEAGVSPEREICFHGGFHRFDARNLVDNPRRDGRCASMSLALGKSLNVVFGKLAEQDLDPAQLRSMAGRFFFNQPLPLASSVADTLVSHADIPEDRLAFSQAAAGFGKVYLSPLHGALLASIIGNGGLAPKPQLVDAVWSDGERQASAVTDPERVIQEDTASEIGRMMQRTVSEGTARKAFRVGRRWALGDIPVAGKTGSLDGHAPFHDYSWFVGYAPADNPTIAVAVVAVNGKRWTVHAPVVARQALQARFDEHDARQAAR